MKRIIGSILCLSFCFSCTGQSKPEIDFLIGEWKRENKEQYEVWEKSDEGLKGYAYKIKEGEKIILETLSIKVHRGQTTYEATVPDQNDGASVPFTLNPEIRDYLSFENIMHDFPKKISYKKIKENEIQVEVKGNPGEGFSFVQYRQEN